MLFFKEYKLIKNHLIVRREGVNDLKVNYELIKLGKDLSIRGKSQGSGEQRVTSEYTNFQGVL